MNFIDYNYYKDTYVGSLDEKTFNRYLVKAEAFLNSATHGRVKDADTLVCFCLCELCDVFKECAGEKNISSESLDGYSVSYTEENFAAWEVLKIYLGGTGLLYGGNL